MGLSMRNNTEIGNTTVQVFKGLAKIVQKYQKLVLDSDLKHRRVTEQLELNSIETQQVLEAAEHLEQNNSENLRKVSSLE